MVVDVAFLRIRRLDLNNWLGQTSQAVQYYRNEQQSDLQGTDIRLRISRLAIDASCKSPEAEHDSDWIPIKFHSTTNSIIVKGSAAETGFNSREPDTRRKRLVLGIQINRAIGISATIAILEIQGRENRSALFKTSQPSIPTIDMELEEHENELQVTYNEAT
ncbi:MAG: hypothetical protein BYD32DRAFT_461805 [Podila humilis]|nr:MAG: hypothetical protein BYD32DRAFT_461805 [Podila humilis]